MRPWRFLAAGAALLALVAAGGAALWAYPKLESYRGLCTTRQIKFDRVQVRTTLLRGGVSMLRAHGEGLISGNVTALVGPEGVFLVDSAHPEIHPQMRAALHRLGSDRVRLVVNTHWHPDHTCGNAALFRRGATIIGDANERADLGGGNEWAPPLTMGSRPSVLMDDDLHLVFNDMNISVRRAPRAHTDSDVFVVFKEANIIAAGDLVVEDGYPIISADGGTIDGYIAAQERILALTDADTYIIPGHGPVMRPPKLRQILAVLRAARARIATLKARGEPVDMLVASRPLDGLAPDWRSADAEDRFVRQTYASLPVEPVADLRLRF